MPVSSLCAKQCRAQARLHVIGERSTKIWLLNVPIKLEIIGSGAVGDVLHPSHVQLFYCTQQWYLDMWYTTHSSQLQVQRIAVAAANDLASHTVFDVSIFPGVCLRKESNPRRASSPETACRVWGYDTPRHHRRSNVHFKVALIWSWNILFPCFLKIRLPNYQFSLFHVRK